MSSDPFYDYCCLEDEECEGRIEWHHAFSTWLNGNRGRLNAIFCILPACSFHHRKADVSKYRERFRWVFCNRASEEELIMWDLVKEKERLNNIYG